MIFIITYMRYAFVCGEISIFCPKTKMKKNKSIFEDFLWRPAVTNIQTEHLHTQVYNPIMFVTLSFFRSWHIVETLLFFCLGTGNGRPEMNFEKKNQKDLRIINLYLPWKFQENLYSHLWYNLPTKKGERVIRKKEKKVWNGRP